MLDNFSALDLFSLDDARPRKPKGLKKFKLVPGKKHKRDAAAKRRWAVLLPMIGNRLKAHAHMPPGKSRRGGPSGL